MDTGSPKSILIKECAKDLAAEKCHNGNLVIEIEGVRVECELQDHDGGEERTRNINLLGTNFLNSVVLIDDFASKLIMVLKRASVPRATV